MCRLMCILDSYCILKNLVVGTQDRFDRLSIYTDGNQGGTENLPHKDQTWAN